MTSQYEVYAECEALTQKAYNAGRLAGYSDGSASYSPNNPIVQKAPAPPSVTPPPYLQVWCDDCGGQKHFISCNPQYVKKWNAGYTDGWNAGYAYATQSAVQNQRYEERNAYDNAEAQRRAAEQREQDRNAADNAVVQQRNAEAWAQYWSQRRGSSPGALDPSALPSYGASDEPVPAEPLPAEPLPVAEAKPRSYSGLIWLGVAAALAGVGYLVLRDQPADSDVTDFE